MGGREPSGGFYVHGPSPPMETKLLSWSTSSRWVHRVGEEHFTIIVDGLDENLRLADGEIVEAILRLAVPILRLVWIWRRLRRDATAASGDDARHAHVVLGIVIREPQLLVVAVACDQQIHSEAAQ